MVGDAMEERRYNAIRRREQNTTERSGKKGRKEAPETTVKNDRKLNLSLKTVTREATEPQASKTSTTELENYKTRRTNVTTSGSKTRKYSDDDRVTETATTRYRRRRREQDRKKDEQKTREKGANVKKKRRASGTGKRTTKSAARAMFDGVRTGRTARWGGEQRPDVTVRREMRDGGTRSEKSGGRSGRDAQRATESGAKRERADREKKRYASKTKLVKERGERRGNKESGPHELRAADETVELKNNSNRLTERNRRTIDQSAGGKLRDLNPKESCAILEDLSLYDNKSWNDPRNFAKPVKEIALPQDVPSTFDRRLIELENQVQRLMEAHLAPTQPTQVKKITTSCEICSGPHDTQYCMEDPEQAFVEYASSRTDEAG
ncbi:hypothetical protein Tco_0252206, partial [Tanacetum coccineum]